VNQPRLTRMSAAWRHGKRIAQGTKRKGESASGKVCAGRRLIRARLRGRRPRGELVGYLTGKLTGGPAG
jgi:hypothetical protein